MALLAENASAVAPGPAGRRTYVAQLSARRRDCHDARIDQRRPLDNTRRAEWKPRYFVSADRLTTTPISEAAFRRQNRGAR